MRPVLTGPGKAPALGLRAAGGYLEAQANTRKDRHHVALLLIAKAVAKPGIEAPGRPPPDCMLPPATGSAGRSLVALADRPDGQLPGRLRPRHLACSRPDRRRRRPKGPIQDRLRREGHDRPANPA